MVWQTCAVSDHGYDSPLANKVNQLLLGANCRMYSYGIWSLGRDLLKLQQVWFDQQALHNTVSPSRHDG